MSNPNYDNIILGSGIAGLTIFYYLTEYTNTRNLLITNNLVSQTNTKFPLGPRYLHVNKNTEALLKKLGFPLNTMNIFIGYKYNGEIRNICSDEFKELYSIKSRKTSEIESSFLSGGGKSTFEAYKVSQIALSKSLLKTCLNIDKNKNNKNKIIVENIKDIIPGTRRLTTEKNTYFFKSIISTIPLNSLFEIISSQSIRFKMNNIERLPVSFYLVNNDSKDKQVFNYIYSISDHWYRRTFIQEMNKFVFETNTEKEFEKEFRNKIIDKITINSQIIKSINMKEIGNIKLVGRYAQMNHKIKTEDVISWAFNYTRKFKNDR